MPADPAPAPERAAAIAPDTRGLNFWALDAGLRDLLEIYVEPRLRNHLVPHLDALGGLAANDLDEWAGLADRHPPVLHPRDRFGNDAPHVEYHPAYRAMEDVAFGRIGLHAMSHRGGVLDWPRPYPAVAKHAFTFLFNQAEFGLGCPINVTDSAAHLVVKYGDAALQQRLLPRMLSTDRAEHWQGGQFLTEKAGGSDVGANQCTARLVDGTWRVSGEKWFCSNVDADVVTLLARVVDAQGNSTPGTAGLGLFVMPRLLDDGTPNHYRIVRLKDKLGTRSMASGEVVLDGAEAWPLGDLSRGFRQMAEMINWSRLSNGVKSAALMRRAAHDARVVLGHREVFGRRLETLPLARRQYLKVLLPGEQALSMWCFTADALDQTEGRGLHARGGGNTAAAVARLATPVLKFRATRDARQVTGDAMELRGGCGYIEEWANARLLRDAHLGSIWEGTGNIVAIDAVQRAVLKGGCAGPYQGVLQDRLDEAHTVPLAFRSRVAGALQQAIDYIEEVAANADDEALSRTAVSNLYHATTAVLMTWEAARIHALRGDARRLLLAALVLRHKLEPRDPFAPSDARWERDVAELLLADRPVSMVRAADLAGY